MKTWRNSRQLPIILGAFLALGSSYAFAGSPLCRQLLISTPISQKSYEAMIENIARLKVSIDLAMVQGVLSQSVEMKVLRSDYDIKLQDLVTALRGSKTEAEVKDLIQKKIREIQDHNSVKDLQEKKQREEQKISIIDYTRKYSFEGRMKFPLRTGGARKFEFIPELQKILVETEAEPVRSIARRLQLFDLATKKAKVIFDDLYAVSISPKLDFAYAVSKGGDILVYDILNNKKKVFKDPVKNLAMIFGKMIVDANESGTQLAVAKQNGDIFLVDTRTGEVKKQELSVEIPGPDYDPSLKISSIKFLNDNNLLILPPNGDLIQFNIKTQVIDIFPLKHPARNSYETILTVPNFEQVVLVSPGGITKVAIENLADIENHKADYYFDTAVSAPLGPLKLAKNIPVAGSGSGNALFVRYENDTMEAGFNLHSEVLTVDESRKISLANRIGADTNLGGFFQNFSMDPVQGKAFVVVYDPSDMKYHLDTWSNKGHVDE